MTWRAASCVSQLPSSACWYELLVISISAVGMYSTCRQGPGGVKDSTLPAVEARGTGTTHAAGPACSTCCPRSILLQLAAQRPDSQLHLESGTRTAASCCTSWHVLVRQQVSPASFAVGPSPQGQLMQQSCRCQQGPKCTVVAVAAGKPIVQPGLGCRTLNVRLALQVGAGNEVSLTCIPSLERHWASRL